MAEISHNTSPWQVFVDTGGTFTDCIAIDPAGHTHRAKVLSTGVVRMRIIRALDPARLLLTHNSSVAIKLLDGCEARLLDPAVRLGHVQSSSENSDGITIVLSDPISFPVRDGAPLELAFADESPIVAARLVTGTPAHQPLPPMSMRLATTRGTNTLLQRRGAPVALFMTRGFGDLLRIGTQQRPELFALRIDKPPQLYQHVLEVPGRLSATGEELEPLNTDSIGVAVDGLLKSGVRIAAVSLMHSWRNDTHERALCAWLSSRGFEHVSCSAALAPSMRILPRAQTAVVNAYLAPALEGYLAGVQRGIGSGSLHVMTSSGGLVRSSAFQPKDSLLSGPAAGVVGARAAAATLGMSKVISFDMGGTSTDVARLDQELDLVFEHRVADAHIVAPAVAVESVAAGGGSIVWYETTGTPGLRVGPQSAGALPGPACYGAGGPLTITDVNLLLGRLSADRFNIPVDIKASQRRARELVDTLQAALSKAVELDDLLEGVIDIADEQMAAAIRTISIQRGYNPAEYVLVAFGGAGGQHACGVAERLGVETVLIPEDVGLLSAAGLVASPLERMAERQVLRELGPDAPWLTETLQALASQAMALVQAEGVNPTEVSLHRAHVSIRLRGQETALVIQVAPTSVSPQLLLEAFRSSYKSTYGYAPPNRPVEVESLRITARFESTKAVEPMQRSSSAGNPGQSTLVRFRGKWVTATTYDRGDLQDSAQVNGPSLVVEPHGTTVIPPGWNGEVHSRGLLLRRAPQPHRHRENLDVVVQEVLTGRLKAIASDMGETLRRTSISTNVKERLDFSCAILNASGELIVNAPHIPVHLGALGLCVRTVLQHLNIEPGDVVMTNHPAFGGSHLPDVTVISPAFSPDGSLIGYIACRAHHAEIGGMRPGSMPPFAKTLAEEGVVLPPMYLIRQGESRIDDVRRALLEAPYPTRSIEENVADLLAQVAANQRGADALSAMCTEVGRDRVQGAMGALMDQGERAIRAALHRLGDGLYSATESLDDGSRLCTTITIADGKAIIDFDGSAGVHPGNFNTPPGVVRSAVMYVLRLLIDEPLPLNEGLMRAVELRIPVGMLNPSFDAEPSQSPAVAAGNVETSQRLVDTLLKAFGLCACSQGTMNNLIFGNAKFGYYETVCGGSGAGPDFDGTDAVHTHMTNTRITDPEVLEHRYPVRLERFAIRTGSGGRGHTDGGCGVVRELTFLEPVSLSILSQHRVGGPYGLHGGHAGLPGHQKLERAGAAIPLSSCDSADIAAGDRLVLLTPGGGGYGTPAAPDRATFA